MALVDSGLLGDILYNLGWEPKLALETNNGFVANWNVKSGNFRSHFCWLIPIQESSFLLLSSRSNTRLLLLLPRSLSLSIIYETVSVRTMRLLEDVQTNKGCHARRIERKERDFKVGQVAATTTIFVLSLFQLRGRTNESKQCGNLAIK